MPAPNCGYCEYADPNTIQLPSGWELMGTPLDKAFIRINDDCPIHNPND